MLDSGFQLYTPIRILNKWKNIATSFQRTVNYTYLEKCSMVHLQLILMPLVTSQLTFTIYSIILSICLVHAIIEKLMHRNVMHGDGKLILEITTYCLATNEMANDIGAVDDTQDKVDYTTAFYFDAVLYIAATTHKYLQSRNNNSIFDLYKDGTF